ncbi:vegetative cell wall protein gp1 [Hypoxylon sp. FL1857]|nr:vegetative cell wall protein gp1 [Hypoxylon sp. FL1857]
MSEDRSYHEHVVPPAGNKRQRTAGMYRRRRAVAACQQCRIRKTKCDNARPVCGFCQKNQGQCIYLPRWRPYLAILDRINYVANLLETRPPSDQGSSQLGPSPASLPPINTTTASISQQICDQDNLTCLDDPEFAAATCSCENILKWPIFRGIAPDIRSFIFEFEDGVGSFSGSHGPESARLGRGVQEDDFIPLSKRFLAFVHVKNPILDLADFRTYVKDASENGLHWDGQSSCLSSPFQRDVMAEGTPDSNRSFSATSADPATASSYYLAAKKRLGLLEPSILQVQCLFLCGVFEMYSLKPLRAWSYFNQASVSFRNLVWMQTQGSVGGMLETQRLEQRLYWSCMKSELELQTEIPLPSSGITRFDYPDLFPSPPSELTSPAPQLHDFGGLPPDIEPEEERSWFYYLAEISYRRVMNRAMVILRRNGEEGWIRDIEGTMKHCEDLDEHIKACREWIRRPMVYYLIHQPSNDPYVPRARPLAEACLSLCVDLLLQVDYRHRHHGSWFVARTSTTRALILLAAARSGSFTMPPQWKEAVTMARSILQYWSTEAPDLQRAAAVLDDIATDMEISLTAD